MTLTLEAHPMTQPRSHRPQRTSAIRRAAVTHLARVLYGVHLHGWRSTQLTESYGRPREVFLTGSARPSGGTGFSALCVIGGVVRMLDTLITERGYGEALRQLTNDQVVEINQYYQRPASAHDSCPDLERSDYRAAYLASRLCSRCCLARPDLLSRHKAGYNCVSSKFFYKFKRRPKGWRFFL